MRPSTSSHVSVALYPSRVRNGRVARTTTGAPSERRHRNESESRIGHKSRPHIGTRIALRNMLAATRATISLITHSPFSAALGGFYTAIADTGGLYRSRALVMGIRVTSHRISNHKRPLRHKACVHITSASGRMAQWQTAKYVETNTTRPL